MVKLWANEIVRYVLARFTIVFSVMILVFLLFDRTSLISSRAPILLSTLSALLFVFVLLPVYGFIALIFRFCGSRDHTNVVKKLYVTEFVSLYVAIAFAFIVFYYDIENPGSGRSFGDSTGQLLRDGVLTELGLRDSLKNIASIVLLACLVQFLSLLYIMWFVGTAEGKNGR